MLLVTLLCLLSVHSAFGACIAGYETFYPRYSFAPECSLCAAGKYSSDGMTCRTCPPLSTTLFSGSSSISDCLCPPGYYAQNAKFTNMTCVACSSNTFNPTRGATDGSACTPCASATSTKVASTTCNCDAGYYFAATATRGCVPCPAGSFNARPGGMDSSVCTLCSVGNYSNTEGSSSCASCFPTGFSVMRGASSCVSCSPLPPPIH